MELYLLRHAHAGNPERWSGPDEVRPLSAKGEAQADRLGRFLAGVHFRPDAIASSPKVRARQTADTVARHLALKVQIDERLGGGLDERILDAVVADLGDPARPVLVGHDPDFSELVASLTGSARVAMRKGAFVRIDVDRPLRAGGGTLRWLVPPDLLDPDR
ncbi:MAG: SixA phosphatase family protein [Chloroflexota bacterium]